MRVLTEEELKLHAEALAEGYRDETCAKCELECLAFHHFIRCNERPCPMLGGNPKSLLDMLVGDTAVTATEGRSDG